MRYVLCETMYLEKLEIQGFKSFANKNVLLFPGMLDKTKRGITAIVGPNGSGKSNVADSVRWALGEQSMKTLRGKKSEDVIFSGSDKKGKLGMAEVSMYLNNEDGRAPIDYSQVVLSRRLYRNGDSEYLINGSRVRLSDIQMLLAKASFGQKTYSVIGQGMVEGFLNTSLSERKEFFDEATGVKQYQIKRDEALNKLRSSYDNLNQATMLISEIEPRLSSLTRQVNKLHKRDELETELKELQINYYAKNWQEIYSKFNSYNKSYLEIEKEKIEKDRKLEQLNAELARLESQNEVNSDFENYQKELNNLQNQKDALVSQMARLDAQIEMSLEREGKFDVSWLISKKSELEKNIKQVDEELESIKNNSEDSKLAELETEKKQIDSEASKLNNKILEISGAKDANKEIRKINSRLKELASELENLENENDLEKLKQVIKKIKSEIQKLSQEAEGEHEKENLEQIQQELMRLAEQKEFVNQRINSLTLKSSSQKERQRLLVDEKAKLNNELSSIEQKIGQQSAQAGGEELASQKKNLSAELEKIEAQISEIKEKINNISKVEEEKRSQLFGLQKNLQNLQNEVNALNNQLNEIKVNSTRYETRLEDLETEIRESLGSLGEVKNKKIEVEINMEQSREKIHSLRRQLEQIGGIDPEIESEYNETKERFDFLSGQVNDLHDTIKSLEKIIKELDLVIKEKFDKEFKVIQDKFQEYFKILFNGGNAKIVKIMDLEQGTKDKEQGTEDVVEESSSAKASEDKDGYVDIKRIKFLQKHNATGLAGIEIQATPPGKKITSISMLSGGERALTAIAMICAIISANPSPFVILDEVDAALDEANSERLAKILDDLSHKTQFIVITHNRASMRRANILYGVTMGDDGVSKLLSVKLDDVEVE